MLWIGLLALGAAAAIGALLWLTLAGAEKWLKRCTRRAEQREDERREHARRRVLGQLATRVPVIAGNRRAERPIVPPSSSAPATSPATTVTTSVGTSPRRPGDVRPARATSQMTTQGVRAERGRHRRSSATGTLPLSACTPVQHAHAMRRPAVPSECARQIS